VYIGIEVVREVAVLIEKVTSASQEFAASNVREKKSKMVLGQSPKRFFLDSENGDSKLLRNVTIYH